MLLKNFVITVARATGRMAIIADSDEENRSFCTEDDQNMAERRWQSIVQQVIVMSQEKGWGYSQHHFVSVAGGWFC